MRTKEYVNEKEKNEGIYTNQEIDEIVAKNEEEILEFCKQVEIEYARWGVYNQYDRIRVLLDLNDGGLHLQIGGQGVSLEIYEGINEGKIVEVYNFETGRLEDSALEGLDYSMEDGETERLYKKYKSEEISEEDYLAKYDTIIQPWLDSYFGDYVNTAVELNTIYPDSINN